MATQEFKGTSWPFIRVHKRRFILFVILLVGLSFLSFTRWEFPSISRANVTQLIGSRSVDEIYGVLHVVTTEHGHILSPADLPVNPSAPSELSLYTKDPTLNWRKEKGRIDQNYPVIVFSKSYCPYSSSAKKLLESYNLQPPPKIIEVDLREDGPVIKEILTRLTHHSTFPNIVVKGKSIGGSDDLRDMHNQRALENIFLGAGAKLKENRSR